MLRHNFRSSIVLSIFILILLSPLIILDVLIVYFFGRPISSVPQLLLLLVMFYVVSFVLSIVLDGFIAVVGDFFQMTTPKLLLFSLDFLISLGVLLFLHSFFTEVSLSVPLMVLIVSVHALVEFLINALPAGEEEKEEIEPSIEYEIKQLLYEKNVIDCIDQISESHPQLSKKTVIKAVRRVSNEMKRGRTVTEDRDSDYYNHLTDNLKNNESISYDHLMFLLDQGREIEFTYNGVEYFIAHVKEGRVLWNQESLLSKYYDDQNEAFVEETKIDQVSLADIFRQRKAVIGTIF